MGIVITLLCARVRAATAMARPRGPHLLALLLLLPGASVAQEPGEGVHPTAALLPLVSSERLAATRAAGGAYRRVATAGDWQSIPKGAQLRAGETDERIVLVRRRLAIESYLAADTGSSEFDAELEEAVKAFQWRNGLLASGILNGETLQALNVSAAARAAQLERSAERMGELLPRMQAGAYVLVNIPSFELQVVAQDRVILYSRVIVGKPSTPSPSITATIRAVDLMPYWHIPAGIVERAIIPEMRKDPTYLARERIRVFSAWGGVEIDPATVNWHAPQASRYLFRQDPGPQNALGLVRIDMPNQFTVYLHDTPLKRLFASRTRPFSAGCVRVQNIYALAGLLLGEEEDAVQRRLAPLLASGNRTTLKLVTPVAVHFTYLTAWTDASGRTEFRSDLYQKDAPSLTVAEAAARGASQFDPWSTRVLDLGP
jgi:murein L,D-transpeptidase YcbB/YkuD